MCYFFTKLLHFFNIIEFINCYKFFFWNKNINAALCFDTLYYNKQDIDNSKKSKIFIYLLYSNCISINSSYIK